MKLEIGYNRPFEIRREIFGSGTGKNFDILFLSDLHFNGFTKGMVSKIAIAISDLNPTIVLFGGDYVDSTKGLFYLKQLLSEMGGRKNMFAIGGNHDYYFGIQKIEDAFVAHNVRWIEKKSIVTNIEDTTIRIDGNLVSKNKTGEDLSILLLHKPIGIDQFYQYYDIAFAGHLHGCQFVLWQSGDNLFPGKFIYQNNFLKTRKENCSYYISKGAGDALPVRYNCTRDIVLVQIVKPN